MNCRYTAEMKKLLPLLVKIASPVAHSCNVPSFPYCCTLETTLEANEQQDSAGMTGTTKTAQSNDPTGDEAGDR